MQFAIWLVGLVCHLSTLVLDTVQHRLHPKQESFIKQLSAYEIVTPVRLNDFGESFPHSLHYRRRRRSLHDDLSGAPPRVHYRIEAFGERFHLNLSADSSFIAPSYTVTHYLGSDRGNVTTDHDMRHCFFRGHVNATSQQQYPAVFSLCTGLIGTFTTQQGEYFLEPLMHPEGEEHDEEHNKPHLVYRRERHGAHSRSHLKTEPCGASGDTRKPGNMAEDQDYFKDIINITETNNSTADHPRVKVRRKRFLSYPRYVELMVTADAKMVRHHGQNLEHYILTIM